MFNSTIFASPPRLPNLFQGPLIIMWTALNHANNILIVVKHLDYWGDSVTIFIPSHIFIIFEPSNIQSIHISQSAIVDCERGLLLGARQQSYHTIRGLFDTVWMGLYQPCFPSRNCRRLPKYSLHCHNMIFPKLEAFKDSSLYATISRRKTLFMDLRVQKHVSKTKICIWRLIEVHEFKYFVANF